MVLGGTTPGTNFRLTHLLRGQGDYEQVEYKFTSQWGKAGGPCVQGIYKIHVSCNHLIGWIDSLLQVETLTVEMPRFVPATCGAPFFDGLSDIHDLP